LESKFRTAMTTVVVAGFVVLLYVSLVRINTEQANTTIDNNLVGYFTAMNKQDYGEMRNYLYPTDNEDYLLDIMLKSKAIGVTSIRLQKIYPALVDRNLAIVGFEVSTNAKYKGEDVTTRQTSTYFFRKRGNAWYIAKPADLQDISQKRISDMIDAYKPIMKENMADSIVEQNEYNTASLKKIKEADKK
jgi:hypothetical protein